jgi:hypothetical protein
MSFFYMMPYLEVIIKCLFLAQVLVDGTWVVTFRENGLVIKFLDI